VPLSLGAAIFALMITWRTGVQGVRKRLAALALPTATFFETVSREHAARVPGTLIFLTRSNVSVPQFMMDYVKNAGALQETVIALHILFDERPRIPDEERCTTAQLEEALWRVTLRYGFVEVPRPLDDLAGAKGLPASVDLETAVFIVSRDIVDAAPSNPLTRWRHEVFAFLFKNGARITDRFNLPLERTLEISRHIKT
jgi:KUP system potassium uptake protein